jgi:hypothetical protein
MGSADMGKMDGVNRGEAYESSPPPQRAGRPATHTTIKGESKEFRKLGKEFADFSYSSFVVE